MKTIGLVLVLMLGVMQYKLWFDNGGVAEAFALHQDINTQLAKNTALTDRNAALAAEVSDLKHGHAAIEEHARNELGMVKQSEQYFEIVSAKSH